MLEFSLVLAAIAAGGFFLWREHRRTAIRCKRRGPIESPPVTMVATGSGLRPLSAVKVEPGSSTRVVANKADQRPTPRQKHGRVEPRRRWRDALDPASATG